MLWFALDGGDNRTHMSRPSPKLPPVRSHRILKSLLYPRVKILELPKKLNLSLRYCTHAFTLEACVYLTFTSHRSH